MYRRLANYSRDRFSDVIDYEGINDLFVLIHPSLVDRCAPINSKLQHTPLATVNVLYAARGAGEFEPCLGGVGNLNRNCCLCSEIRMFIFNGEVFVLAHNT